MSDEAITHVRWRTTQDLKWLSFLGACEEGRRYVLERGGLERAWQHCTRPEWLIWLLAKTTPTYAADVRAKLCDVVEEILPNSEERHPTPEHLLNKARRMDDFVMSLYYAVFHAANVAEYHRLGTTTKWCDRIRARFECPQEQYE